MLWYEGNVKLSSSLNEVCFKRMDDYTVVPKLSYCVFFPFKAITILQSIFENSPLR